MAPRGASNGVPEPVWSAARSRKPARSTSRRSSVIAQARIDADF